MLILLPGDETNLTVIIEPDHDEWPPLLAMIDHDEDNEQVAAVDLTPEKAEKIAAGLVAWAATVRARTP